MSVLIFVETLIVLKNGKTLPAKLGQKIIHLYHVLLDLSKLEMWEMIHSTLSITNQWYLIQIMRTTHIQ